MADINLQYAMAIETQTTLGTISTAVAGLTTPVTIADGLIYGDADSGTRGTGIEFSTEPKLQERGSVAGSKTALIDSYLGIETVANFTVTMPFTGSLVDVGGALADSDFDLATHYPALDALLRCCGLVGAGGAGDSWDYTPVLAAGTTEFCSAMIWDSGFVHGVKDIRGDFSIKYDPGEVPIITFTLQGIVDTAATQTATFPATVTYGVWLTEQFQAAESAVTAEWAGTIRSFTELEVASDNKLTAVKDITADEGKRVKLGSPRVYTLSGTMIANSADARAEYDAMVGTGAGDTYVLQIGAATAINTNADAHKLTMTGLRPTTVKTIDLEETGSKGVEFEATLSNTVDGAEFALNFL